MTSILKTFDKENDTTSASLTCGIVMPIASLGDYSEAHWAEVYQIIKEAIGTTVYEVRLVSESKDSTVIPKSIVQNLYDDDIVVCDVSGKNPNVMFELGMRLAFDKPVVLIKDDVTGYSFDTSSIEHLTYPRDLRYSEIQKFKKKLADKLIATHKTSQEPSYRSFLSNFANIKVAKIENKTVNESEILEIILKKIDHVENQLKENHQAETNKSHRLPEDRYILYKGLINVNDDDFQKIKNYINERFGDLINFYFRRNTGEKGYKVLVESKRSLDQKEYKDIMNEINSKIEEFDDGLPF